MQKNKKHASNWGGTSAAEAYLITVYRILQENQDNNREARVADVARRLNVSQASVTNMMQRLGEAGFIHYERYRGLTLTRRGTAVAERVYNRNTLLTRLLQLLNVEPAAIIRDVDGLEHHISPETYSRLQLLTNALENNDHFLHGMELATTE